MKSKEEKPCGLLVLKNGHWVDCQEKRYGKSDRCFKHLLASLRGKIK
jgi:hypothetical protein